MRAYYDVGIGLEDTNALALAFTDIADENYGCRFTTETRPGVAACPAN